MPTVQITMIPFARRLAGAAIAAALVACSDSSGPDSAGSPVDILVSAGSPQSGAVGEWLTQPVAARVNDADGRPVPGVQVNFQVTSGGGEVTPASAMTNAAGIATANWRLGTVAGATHRLRAILVNLSTGAVIDTAIFTATADPGPPHVVQPLAATSADLTAGVAATDFLSVRVSDEFGNPLPGVPVHWAVTGAGATLGSNLTNTGPSGEVTNTITASGVGADGVVTATAGTVSTSFTFRAFNVAPTVAVLGGEAFGAFVTSGGEALVTNIWDGKLHRFAAAAPGAITDLALGASPVNVVADRAAAFAYVANMGSETSGLQIVNLATNTIAGTVNIPNGGHAIAMSPDEARVFVTSSTSNVWIVDVATRTIVDTILVTGGPWGMAFRRAGADTLVYVGRRDGASIVEANARTGAVLRTFAVGGRPHGIAISADGATLWVANQDLNVIQRVSTATGAVIGTIPLGGAFDVALSADGATLFATSVVAGSLVIDVATATPVRRFTHSWSGRHVAPRDDTTALVTLSNGSVVSIAR